VTSVLKSDDFSTLELSQERMIGSMLERYGIAKSSTLPMDPHIEVTPAPHDKARRRIERQIKLRTIERSLNNCMQRYTCSMQTELLPKDEHSGYMAIIGAVQYIAVIR
jgi:hypothetical protein